jgi:ubiquinone biosynthesis protein UbiJ
MLEAMKSMAQRSVMERLVLFVNHVVSSEPVALEKLRPHSGRTMTFELTDWPAMLPAIGPLTFRVTPAGLVEWPDAPADTGLAPAADLRVAIAAGNPAVLLGRLLTGERPAITVSGDAAFASDIDWLIDNLRWDAQDDLARFVGDGPAREISKLGGFVAGAFRDAAKGMRDLASRGGNGGGGGKSGAGPGSEPPRR